MDKRMVLPAVLGLAVLAGSVWAQEERRGERGKGEPGARGEQRRGEPGQPGGGPGGPPMGEGRGPGEMRPMGGQADVPPQLAEFLEQFDPRRLEELRRARVMEPDRFRDMIGRAFEDMRRLERIKREDPKRYELLLRQRELDRQTFELARQLREGDAAKKDEAKAKLKAALADLFDLREDEREQEISEMTERLERMKDTARLRRENKDAIVENRLKEMTGENEHLRW
ncbi:MAG: hypothetical protein FJ279_15205 [Planctomycetes bacterium]|nr:hypothetical protein [Verrucomicrobiota bacterium]MBM4046456.1 hypothetical protein [Planctomycetota bacterium]